MILDDVHLSLAVGWFTLITPVLLEAEDVEDLGETFKAVGERLLAISQPPHRLRPARAALARTRLRPGWLHFPKRR